MKGLKQYLRKRGKHFTVALAKDSVPIKWDFPSIERYIKDEVWYNCWSATEGDMLYLVNIAYKYCKKDKRTCILFMLGVVGDYNNWNKWFDAWILETDCLDLKDYI